LRHTKLTKEDLSRNQAISYGKYCHDAKNDVNWIEEKNDGHQKKLSSHEPFTDHAHILINRMSFKDTDGARSLL